MISLVIKPGVVDKCKTSHDLKGVDMTKEENLLPNKDMELGFGVREVLKKLIREDTVTKKDVRKFWEEAKSVIVSIIYKPFERCPILSDIVRFSSVLDPAVFLTLSKSTLQNRMKNCWMRYWT